MSAEHPSHFPNFDAAITSPPLHAIAQYWVRARGRRLMPAWSDLYPFFLSPHFDMLWGFSYDSKTDTFRGTLAGKSVKDWLGPNFFGSSLNEIHPPHVYEGAHHFLRKVVTTPAAGRCSGKLFTAGNTAVTGERIALPMATDGITADGVLGASYYEGPPPPGPVELIHDKMEWFAI